MPDSPAQNNFAALKKLSLDPGTERMATKDELISLLDRAAETHATSSEIPALAQTQVSVQTSSQLLLETAAASNSSSVETQLARKVEISKVVDVEIPDDKPNMAKRAIPIPEIPVHEPGTHVDLVELAAILDQHRIW